MLLRAKGVWKVTRDSIRIVTNMDFCRLYLWLFMRGTYNLHKMQLPKHGGHINIISPRIHKKDCSDYLYLNGREVWFYYSVSGNMGGFSRGFRNWWLDVNCQEAEEVLREFGFKKQDGFSLLHHSIANNKSSALQKLS